MAQVNKCWRELLLFLFVGRGARDKIAVPGGQSESDGNPWGGGSARTAGKGGRGKSAIVQR